VNMYFFIKREREKEAKERNKEREVNSKRWSVGEQKKEKNLENLNLHGEKSI